MNNHPCIECGRPVSAAQRRRLCWTCRHDPAVRARHQEPQRECARCGARLSSNPACSPDGLCRDCRTGKGQSVRMRRALDLLPEVDTGPTDAPCWSSQRLAVLMARARAGLPVFDRRDVPGEAREGFVREEVASDDGE